MTGPGPTPWAAIDATWPPVRSWRVGAWTLRDGDGAGRRTCAATLEEPAGVESVAEAEAAMRDAGLAPLFMVRGGEEALDAQLTARGYVMEEPSIFLIAPIARIAAFDRKGLAAIRTDGRLARMDEIWEAGGIGPGRRAAIDRVTGPRLCLLGRAGDRPAGVVFVAVAGDIAMIHALVTLPAFRRQGVAQALTGGAASWAMEQGATHFALQVARGNPAANVLYVGMGMEEVGHYHYRRREP
ncbi:MAG: GNAT family N-acetyltransferase [Pseudomonadota bacterium]